MLWRVVILAADRGSRFGAPQPEMLMPVEGDRGMLERLLGDLLTQHQQQQPAAQRPGWRLGSRPAHEAVGSGTSRPADQLQRAVRWLQRLEAGVGAMAQLGGGLGSRSTAHARAALPLVGGAARWSRTLGQCPQKSGALGGGGSEGLSPEVWQARAAEAALGCWALESLEPRRAFNRGEGRIQISHRMGHSRSCIWAAATPPRCSPGWAAAIWNPRVLSAGSRGPWPAPNPSTG